MNAANENTHKPRVHTKHDNMKQGTQTRQNRSFRAMSQYQEID